MSDWNMWMERCIEADLTACEARLAMALARLLLGFRTRSERFGRQLVRETAQLHGRSLERALNGLVEKGLVRYESSGPGRSKRSLYELILDDQEMAAEARPFEFPAASETAAGKAAEKAAEKGAAPRRGIQEQGERILSSGLALATDLRPSTRLESPETQQHRCCACSNPGVVPDPVSGWWCEGHRFLAEC